MHFIQPSKSEYVAIIIYILRPPSLSELTPIIFNIELTHLNSEAFIFKLMTLINIWRLPSLSELNPMIFNTGLTHLGSEASI